MAGRLDPASVLRSEHLADPAVVVDVLPSATREFAATDVELHLVELQLVLEPT